MGSPCRAICHEPDRPSPCTRKASSLQPQTGPFVNAGTCMEQCAGSAILHEQDCQSTQTCKAQCAGSPDHAIGLEADRPPAGIHTARCTGSAIHLESDHSSDELARHNIQAVPAMLLAPNQTVRPPELGGHGAQVVSTALNRTDRTRKAAPAMLSAPNRIACPPKSLRHGVQQSRPISPKSDCSSVRIRTVHRPRTVPYRFEWTAV